MAPITGLGNFGGVYRDDLQSTSDTRQPEHTGGSHAHKAPPPPPRRVIKQKIQNAAGQQVRDCDEDEGDDESLQGLGKDLPGLLESVRNLDPRTAEELAADPDFQNALESLGEDEQKQLQNAFQKKDKDATSSRSPTLRQIELRKAAKGTPAPTAGSGFTGKSKAAGKPAQPDGSLSNASLPSKEQSLSLLYGDGAKKYGDTLSANYRGLPPDLRADFMGKQLKISTAAEEHIAGLGQKLMNGDLSLNDAHKMAPSEYGGSDNDDGLGKAAKWINYASNSLRSDPNSFEKTRAMLEGIQRDKVALDSMEGLEEINRRVTKSERGSSQNSALRLRGMESSLPFSATGVEGLKTGLSWARQANTADNSISGSERGAFLLGATLRAHGFEDGNGRTARAAFALSQLQDDGKFDAITTEREDELSGL